jgi:hypothetical protein
MPTIDYNGKGNADRLPSSLYSKRRETVNTLIKANANIITAVNANYNELSKKISWQINELDSLGTKKSSSNTEKNEPKGSQELEDLTYGIKQRFIRDYKICYNESANALKYLCITLMRHIQRT